MLEVIQKSATKIQNRSDTLRWGSCMSDNMLVLACGHPNSQFRDIVLYFVVTEDEGKVCIYSDIAGVRIGHAYCLVAPQALAFIVNTLKEVFK